APFAFPFVQFPVQLRRHHRRHHFCRITHLPLLEREAGPSAAGPTFPWVCSITSLPIPPPGLSPVRLASDMSSHTYFPQRQPHSPSVLARARTTNPAIRRATTSAQMPITQSFGGLPRICCDATRT